MFDTIAPRYDLINRLMTFGLDQAWRRGTVAALALPEGARVLDLACGTGDLSRLAQRRGYRVVGADLSAGMLGANGASTPLVEADGSRLPFADGAFDGLVCGYALRNFTDLAATLAESARVLRPGGRLAVLEVDTPTAPLWRAGYDLWFTKAVPALGAALSDREAYRYLPQSVAYLPPTPVLRAMLREAGLLRRRDPPPRRWPEPDGGGHPRRRAVTTGLHARTVPLEYGPDALEFDGSPTVLFDRPGLTLVGWGTALLVTAAEAAAALAAIPCDDAVGTIGSGPVALGALPFTDAFAGHLVIPRFTLGTSRDVDGVTRRWATAVGPADTPLPETDELFDAVIWQYGTAPPAVTQTEARPAELTTSMDTRGLCRHGVRRRRRDGRPRRHPAQGGAVPARRASGCPGRSPWRPCCAGSAPPNPTAPSSPCRSPTAPSSGPAPSSWSPATAPGSRATRWRAPCRVATPPAPTPMPSATSPGPPRTAPSTATSSRRSRRPWRPFCAELSAPRGALAGRLPVGGPPRHADRGHARPPDRGAPAPRAPASHAGRRRHARAEALAFIAAARGGRAGLLGRAGGLGRCRGRRRVDDRHPQRAAARRRRAGHVAGRLGHRGRLRPRGRGRRDERQAGDRPRRRRARASVQLR